MRELSGKQYRLATLHLAHGGVLENITLVGGDGNTESCIQGIVEQRLFQNVQFSKISDLREMDRWTVLLK